MKLEPQEILNIAARTSFERFANDDDLQIAQYRFDTFALLGDYTMIAVPLPFASEEAARTLFFLELKTAA
jgi:hypothetical protein